MAEHDRPGGSVPATLSQALAQKIRELLQAQGWSQREFARRLGVTQGAVSYLLAEKRRAEVLDYYERLAGIFGVSLSELIADLEQRTRGAAVSTKGAQDARAQTPTIVVSAAATATSGVLLDSVVFHALLDRLLDVHATAQRAQADADALRAALAQGVDAGGPAAPRRRKPPRAAAAHRPGDRGPAAGAVRPGPVGVDGLAPRRDLPAGDHRALG